jgi:hypothetical protein
MAADILGEIVEGPEEDAVFELYGEAEEVQEEDEEMPSVDEEAYHEVIEVDDSD